MDKQPNNWPKQRRDFNRANAATSETAMTFSLRHLKAGALASASRAALLAQRLMRVEAEQAERARKQDIKRAIERSRAEAALEEAPNSVASLSDPSPRRYKPPSNNGLHSLLARASTHADPSHE